VSAIATDKAERRVRGESLPRVALGGGQGVAPVVREDGESGGA
jgi:hypothetical protein